MGAFPFSKIEPHQNFFLNEYNKCMGVISYVILGVNAGRGDQRMYVFEWNDFMEFINNENQAQLKAAK